MPNKKKIKVFLGGYINSINAQNLNCRSLAQHLDKSRFEIFTLSLYSGKLPLIKDIRIFHCFRPKRLSCFIGYLWGIWNADVIYLPKRELVFWNSFVVILFGKRSFTTIEGVIDGINLKKALSFYGSIERMAKFINSFSKAFSITDFLRKKNWELHNFITQEQILSLGVDSSTFTPKVKDDINAVVLIGGNLKNKGWDDYMELASFFPDLKFHVVGSGDNVFFPEEEIREKKMKNVTCHGVLNHESLNILMQQVDLHVFPSRFEGFPKVILETSCAGVPSLIYSDYGAHEWMTHNKNGFIVETLTEMQETISFLKKNKKVLKKVSFAAIKLGKSFDWKMIVKTWEVEIEKLAKS